jgi:hypothetical protein
MKINNLAKSKSNNYTTYKADLIEEVLFPAIAPHYVVQDLNKR